MSNIYVEYKPNEKYAEIEAPTSDTFEHYQDAGRLFKDNEIVVDVDDIGKDKALDMVKHFDIKTEYYITDRGLHLVYLKPNNYSPKAKGICALGFNIEHKYKRGKNISHCIKRKGIAREVRNKGSRLELPFIFRLRKNYDLLQGMGKGDGRNTGLYILRAKINSDVKENEMMHIIEFVNDKVFSEPLPLDEIITITREDLKFDVSKEGTTETDVARHLISEWGIVKYYGNIWYKNNDNVYITDDPYLKHKILEFYGSAKSYTIDEIIKQIDNLTNNAPNDILMNKTFPIKFKNGILKDGIFIEVIYDDFTPYYIDIDYNENAKPVKIVDDYFNHLTNNDKDYRDIIFEMIGHIFVTDIEMKRLLASFFIMVGKAGAGKGTLLSVIRNIVGINNTTGLDISQLADDRYMMGLKQKLVNLGDDVQDSVIKNEEMKILKNISTADYIQGRELFKMGEGLILSNTLIFTSNHILKTFEKGEAYRRRVKFLPIFNSVKEKRDILPELMEEKALEYIVKLSIEGYFRLYKNKKLTTSKMVDDWTNEYHEENDNVTMFLSGYTVDDLIGRRPPEVQEEYYNWSVENGFTDDGNKNYNKNRLREVIEDTFKLKSKSTTVNGEKARVFLKI